MFPATSCVMDLQNDLHTCTAVFTAAAGQAERLAGKVTKLILSAITHMCTQAKQDSDCLSPGMHFGLQHVPHSPTHRLSHQAMKVRNKYLSNMRPMVILNALQCL